MVATNRILKLMLLQEFLEALLSVVLVPDLDLENFGAHRLSCLERSNQQTLLIGGGGSIPMEKAKK
jgi:hypothetical protein